MTNKLLGLTQTVHNRRLKILQSLDPKRCLSRKSLDCEDGRVGDYDIKRLIKMGFMESKNNHNDGIFCTYLPTYDGLKAKRANYD